jgi:hypothetical protein
MLLGRFAPRPGFIGAKDLFIEAKGPTRPGTKTSEIDQNVEPIARTRRPMGAALKMLSAVCLMNLIA